MRHKSSKTRYPGIQKVGEGIYRIRIKIRDPKTGRFKEVDRLFEGLKSLREAERKKEELREQLEAGSIGPAIRMKVKDYARSWLSTKLPTLKPSTSSRYALALDLHLLPFFGDMFIDAVEQTDVLAFRDAQSIKYKPSTVNGQMRILGTLFKDAVIELDLSRDPTARVKALPIIEVDSDPNCLTAKELVQLLQAVQKVCPQHYAIFRTLAETGMRVSEVASLRWEDIDEDNSIIHIRRSHWHGQVGTTKTNRTRTVPLTDELAKVLAVHRKRLLEQQAPGFAAGWVFPSKNGTLMFGSSLHKPLREALDKARIDQRFTLHGFRRTFNNLMRQVASGEVVRAMTGHVTERMTAHYSHIGEEEKRTAVSQALSAVLTPKSGDGGGDAEL